MPPQFTDGATTRVPLARALDLAWEGLQGAGMELDVKEKKNARYPTSGSRATGPSKRMG